MILADHEIKALCEKQEMIVPFEPKQIKMVEGEPVVSFGLSSYGYDIRVGNEFMVFTNVHGAVIDPKKFSKHNFVPMSRDTGEPIQIPPNSFALARSLEKIKMPRNCMAICLGKSTYARCGIVVNVTPLEPEWEGVITMEISNTAPNPAWVYAGEGIAQILFLRGESPDTSYRDKNGKYQGQTEITPPRM